MTTIYIVTEALNFGVMKADAEIGSDGIAVGKGFTAYPAGYTLTAQGAEDTFYDMRERKLSELRKEIARLESLQFVIKDH